MKWICFKDHDWGAWTFVRTPRPQECASFREFLFVHLWFAHASEPWRQRWICWGFIDAEGDGEPAFWRWDFWNSNMKRLAREERDREFERKRAVAIARWGEGAG